MPLGFLGLCVLPALTPGPVRYAIAGRRPAVASALGAIESGVAATEMVVFAVAAAGALRLLKRPRVRDRLGQVSAGVPGAPGIGTIASAD